MMISSNMPVSAESINAMLDEVLSEEHKGARAQAESAHQAEQAQLGQRVASMREQAESTKTAGIVSAIAGFASAGTSMAGSFATPNGPAAQRWGALGETLKSAAGAINAGFFSHDAAMSGIAAEEHQARASDAAHAAQMALDRAGELRQARDRVTNMVDRNEETRHATNMLFRA